MSNLLKNLLIALGITVVIGVVHFGLKYMNATSEDTTFQESGTSEAKLITDQILRDIQKIDELSLNTDVFQDQRFRSLKDFRIEIKDVSTGRANPFEPVR